MKWLRWESTEVALVVQRQHANISLGIHRSRPSYYFPLPFLFLFFLFTFHLSNFFHPSLPPPIHELSLPAALSRRPHCESPPDSSPLDGAAAVRLFQPAAEGRPLKQEPGLLHSCHSSLATLLFPQHSSRLTSLIHACDHAQTIDCAARLQRAISSPAQHRSREFRCTHQPPPGT